MIIIRDRIKNIILIALILVTLFGTLTFPVMGNEYLYTPWCLTSQEPLFQKTLDNKYIQYKNTNWSHEENKFSTDLQILLYPDKNPFATPEMSNSTLHTLTILHKLVTTDDFMIDQKINGNTSLGKSDVVYVSITTKPGISSHILDSYLYPPIIRNENIFGLYPKYGGNIVDAWVEFSKLKEIANISEVMEIQTVITSS